MLSEVKRKIYFILLCIPVRLMLAAVPLILNKRFLPYFGFLVGIMGTNMLYLFFKKMRLNAFEGGGNTWWANFRLLHGALYLTASILAYCQNYKACIPLFLDAFVGLILHFSHHKYF